MVLRTTRITVETESLMVVRRAKATVAWCPDCHAEVDVITLTQDSFSELTTAAQMQRWLGTGKLHLWQSRRGHSPDLREIAIAMLRVGGKFSTFSSFHCQSARLLKEEEK